MIGRAADKIFTRVFIFLIMTVYFWIYTVAGLVVLGIGPAFRTVTEMHMDKQWIIGYITLRKDGSALNAIFGK